MQQATKFSMVNVRMPAAEKRALDHWLLDERVTLKEVVVGALRLLVAGKLSKADALSAPAITE